MGRTPERGAPGPRRLLLPAGALLLAGCTLALASTRPGVLGVQAAFASRGAGRCVPSALNRSAAISRTPVSVSPLPGSYDASPRTQISLVGAPVRTLAVRVRGSQTGLHSGVMRPYSQGDGASFVPSKPFRPGETVSVRGRVGRRAFLYTFAVARFDTSLYVAPPARHSLASREAETQHFHSRPDLQPPVLSVSATSPQTAGGYVLTSPYSGPGPSGLMIFDEAGNLVWFAPLPKGIEPTNLQVQAPEGTPLLTWWQGHVTTQGFGQGEAVIADSSYRVIGHVHAGNGYTVDLHDFHVSSAGTAVFTAFQPIYCDLSSYGGPADGAVTDNLIQEVDLRTGLVRREWHSLDHISPADSYSNPATASAAWPFDYFHLNSIQQLPEGRTLISARNTWGMYSLGTASGQVLTRIGGRHSDVKLASGAATAFQHDASFLEGGALGVFDNGAVPKVHPQSRGLLVQLDPVHKTASVVAQFTHPTPLISGSQGNMQLLSNGDVFLGWGSEPYFSEFSPGGQLLYDAHMRGSYQSYRAYRFPWTGAPSEAPAIAAGGAPGTPPTVYASWNGDTRTVAWRLLAGPSPEALAPIVSVPRSGFETAIAAPAPEPYVAVQALDASGAVLGASKTVAG
jgi:hypothetical protein